MTYEDRGWTVLAFIGERDITKHVTTKAEAVKIAKKIKDAAAVLSLMDIVRVEILQAET